MTNDEYRNGLKLSEPTKPINNERDGFFKTALVAAVSNFAALNIEIPPEMVVQKCARLVALEWEALMQFRNSGTDNF